MEWLECIVYTNDAGISPVCDALSGVGLDQVCIEESRETAMAFLNESAVYWDYADADKIGVDTPCVKAYLADTAESMGALNEAKAAIARLSALYPSDDLGTLSIVVNRVRDEDWMNSWKAYYRPLSIGNRLYVCPRWIDEPTPARRVKLALDPGVAFGTGSHHTTRMCLELLEGCLSGGETVLDLGCGSGILSIAAILLGAKSAVAVDIDPVAEHVARENAAQNGISEKACRVEIGDVVTNEALQARIAGKYDVVVANIVASVIISLAPFALTCLKSGAPFVVSGVIEERENEVVSALTNCGLVLRETRRSESWVAMRFSAPLA